ncbi:MAG: hypothetical protein ACFFBD_27060 [Candidatus Hodarchaeota archaeon]
MRIFCLSQQPRARGQPITANAIKTLFDQGKFQAVVDQLAQWEADGLFDTFTEKEQIECIYYQSFALDPGLGHRDEALQLVLTARQKYPSPTDRSLLLALITFRLIYSWILTQDEENAERAYEEHVGKSGHLAISRWAGICPTVTHVPRCISLMDDVQHALAGSGRKERLRADVFRANLDVPVDMRIFIKCQ